MSVILPVSPVDISRPVREEDLRRWIDAIAAAEIDTFVQEVYTQGWSVYWRGDGFEYDARPQHRLFLPLLDSGVQPLQVLIDATTTSSVCMVASIGETPMLRFTPSPSSLLVNSETLTRCCGVGDIIYTMLPLGRSLSKRWKYS